MTNRQLVFCADLQARESVYKHNQDLKDDDLVALKQVVDFCNDPSVRCDALILGGDQVDSPRIGDEHVIQLRRILRGCKAPVYYIDGNHERGFRRLELEGGSASVALSLEHHPFIFAGYTVTGCGWKPRREWEQIQEHNIPTSDILILHGFADQAIEQLGLSSAAASSGGLGDFDLNWFDGVCKLCLMGDIHQYMHFEGSKHATQFYYPGSMWMHRANEPTDKYFLTIDDNLDVNKIDLETRPFFKVNINSIEDITELLHQVRAAISDSSQLDPRIQKPRVHIDVYSEDNLDKEIDELRKEAHLFVRMKPSKTITLVENRSTEPGLIDLKEIINSMVDKEEEDLRFFLNEIFESGVEDAAERLREKLGVN